MYDKLRDRYYHLLLGLIGRKEFQHWINQRVKALGNPTPWMVAVLSAKDRKTVLQVVGAELGPFVPMNYYSLMGSLLVRFSSGLIDIHQLEKTLQRLIEFDPMDNVAMVNLALQVTYIRDALLDDQVDERLANKHIFDAFEECEEEILLAESQEAAEAAAEKGDD
jgi:hypothetical protein